MTNKSNNPPVTTLAPVELKLPLLKAKHVAPVLKDLAHALDQLTGQPELAAEIRRIIHSLEHIKHGQKIHAHLCIIAYCENGP